MINFDVDKNDPFFLSIKRSTHISADLMNLLPLLPNGHDFDIKTCQYVNKDGKREVARYALCVECGFSRKDVVTE